MENENKLREINKDVFGKVRSDNSRVLYGLFNFSLIRSAPNDNSKIMNIKAMSLEWRYNVKTYSVYRDNYLYETEGGNDRHFLYNALYLTRWTSFLYANLMGLIMHRYYAVRIGLFTGRRLIKRFYCFIIVRKDSRDKEDIRSQQAPRYVYISTWLGILCFNYTMLSTLINEITY